LLIIVKAERSEFCVSWPSSFDNQNCYVIMFGDGKPSLKEMSRISRLSINNIMSHTDLWKSQPF